MRKVLVLGTGGTIAGVGQAHDYQAAQLGVAELLRSLPGPALDCEWVTEQIAQVDSKDMDFAVWQRCAQRVAQGLADDSVQGIVILHGTDTLEETAFFLHCLFNKPSKLSKLSKPIVLTGAMRPATDAQADGPQNLKDALLATQPNVPGVWVVFAGEIHHASKVQKVHAQRLKAFDSGDAGSAESLSSAPVHGDALAHVLQTPPAQWPWVEIVMNYTGGVRPACIESWVTLGVQGLVIAGTGNGTVHQATEAALLQAQAQGVQVLRSTRCAYGSVQARADDVLRHTPLSPVKARIALILDLLARAH